MLAALDKQMECEELDENLRTYLSRAILCGATILAMIVHEQVVAKEIKPTPPFHLTCNPGPDPTLERTSAGPFSIPRGLVRTLYCVASHW